MVMDFQQPGRVRPETIASFELRYAELNPFIFHTNGIPWHDAPVPGRFHTCRVQTYGAIDREMISRCACGAIRIGGMWLEKNSRARAPWWKRVFS